MTKQHLSNHTLSENIPNIADIWNNTISSLSDFTQVYTDTESSPEIELLKAAEMIGCQINFNGDRPVGRKTTLLFYALVREALTNAVMHAKANKLIVTVRQAKRGYHVKISDNGGVRVSCVTEGNGLSNLRRRLEQEGATLQIKCSDSGSSGSSGGSVRSSGCGCGSSDGDVGVILVAEFPEEGKVMSADTSYESKVMYVREEIV
jgi:hypothetical protein